jgi:hypothetical protein
MAILAILPLSVISGSDPGFPITGDHGDHGDFLPLPLHGHPKLA